MKNALVLTILFLMTLVFKTGWSQTITVPNPSFERTASWGSGSQAAVTYNYWEWYRCNPQGTADMMAGDGLWGVNKPAQHLGYYGFMLAPWPHTHQWESIGADLSTPFIPCQPYEFTVQLANMKRSPSGCPENGNAYSNQNWEIELELYGTDTCGFDELLWESGHITHCDWQEYTVTFTPCAAYTQIHWRPKMVDLVALGLPVGWQRTYAVGVDNMSDIVPLIAPVTGDTIYVELCEGDSVFAAGAYQTVSGIYNDSLQTACGCDSIISTIVNVSPANIQNTSVEICAGDSALIGGVYQTIAGIYNDTLQSVGSCDSIISTTLNVLPAYFYSATVDICNGDSALIGGVYQTIEGTYSDTVQLSSSCDSITIITLNVLSAFIYNTSVDICDGDSLFLGGDYQTVSGTYNDTIQTVSSCDSIISTTLNVLPAYVYNTTVDICNGDSVLIGGVYQTIAGIYSDTLQSVSSCDSIIDITLNVSSVYIQNTSVDICDGDSLFVGGGYQIVSGTYNDTIQSASSCDSIISTTLNVLPAYFYSTTVDICNGDSVLIGGVYQTTAGIYNDTFQTINGCDSIVSTTLTIVPGGSAAINEVFPICEGDVPVSLSAINSGGVWSGDGIINPTIGVFDPSIVGAGLWTVTYTIAGSCGDSQNTIVEVMPDLNLSIDLVTEHCPDDPDFYLIANSAGGNWIGSGVDSQTGFFSIEDAGPGTHSITYDMYDQCVNPVTIDVVVLYSCPEPVELTYYVPNAFTPDGDEHNQIFQPVFTSGYDPFEFHMIIFNRWGEVVFESYSADVGWDGTYANNLVADGVYVWKIEFKQLNVDKRIKLIGHVNLLR